MKKTFIYTLKNPKTNVIRYIGKSNTPRKRLYKHIVESKSGSVSYKNNWIKSLLDKGIRPVIRKINDCCNHIY